MMLDEALERIAEKVRRAREMDARPFGAESRGIPDFHPPLPTPCIPPDLPMNRIK
jgi:hypothetical protein